MASPGAMQAAAALEILIDADGWLKLPQQLRTDAVGMHDGVAALSRYLGTLRCPAAGPVDPTSFHTDFGDLTVVAAQLSAESRS